MAVGWVIAGGLFQVAALDYVSLLPFSGRSLRATALELCGNRRPLLVLTRLLGRNSAATRLSLRWQLSFFTKYNSA